MVLKNKQLACDEFFSRSTGFCFFTIIAAFTEEIIILKDRADYYYKIAEEKNFVYNETYSNCPKSYYNDIYDEYKDNLDEYKKYNPQMFLNPFLIRKYLSLIYLFINTQIYFV